MNSSAIFRWVVLLVVMLWPLSVMAQTESHTTATLRHIHDIVEKTNLKRINRGLAPLKLDDCLIRAAVHHARDMAKFGYFAHSTPGAGRGVEDYEVYARTENYRGRTGQNLYRGEPIADEVVDLWMNSPDHRSNLLEAKYNEVGVGLARSQDDELYCVQFFGIHPAAYPVVINNESYCTCDTTVHLYIYGEGRMTRMRFSTDGTVFSQWEPFQSQKEWTLPPGEGKRTIWVEVSDGEKTFRSMDSIFLEAEKL